MHACGSAPGTGVVGVGVGVAGGVVGSAAGAGAGAGAGVGAGVVVFFGGSLEVCALSLPSASSPPLSSRVLGTAGAEQPVSAIAPRLERARRETATSLRAGFMFGSFCTEQTNDLET
jgi:hypothetical protein